MSRTTRPGYAGTCRGCGIGLEAGARAVHDRSTTGARCRACTRGEELLGARLDGLAGRGVRALHHRRIPRTWAAIDHITVGPAGVHVIDARRSVGKRPERRVAGRLSGTHTEHLYVGSRDRTALVEGVHNQVAVVRAALDGAGLGDVPVHGVLCFVAAAWPLIRTSFVVDDVDVLRPKRLAERLVVEEPGLAPDAVDASFRVLAGALPSA